jgi:hypothetical protein
MKKLALVFAISMSSFASSQLYAANTQEALDALKSALTKYGEPKVEGTFKAGDEEVPALSFGSKKMGGNTDAVDNVKKKHGGTATIFVAKGTEFIRLTTNVLKDDGTRAIGTPLAHNKAYDALMKGEKFCGEVEILKAMYDTCYEPIKGKDGKTLGVYYVGFKK